MGSSGVLVMSNPMTAPNDIIVGGAAGAPTRLPKGANNSLLAVDGVGNVNYNTSQMAWQLAVLYTWGGLDVFNNFSLAANTPVNLTGNIPITVQSATSLIEVIVRCGLYTTSAPANNGGEVHTYLMVDSTRYN